MQLNPDVRWKQRFQSFDRALVLLREAAEGGPSSLNQLENEGAIQRFEYSHELAWKTAKDFLEDSGAVIAPRTRVKWSSRPSQPKSSSTARSRSTRSTIGISGRTPNDCAVFEEAVEALAARYLAALEQLHEFVSVKNLE